MNDRAAYDGAAYDRPAQRDRGSNDGAAGSRARWPALIAGAVLAALITAPGRPENQPAPSPRRTRIFRAAAIAQACLAAGLFIVYLVGPWSIDLGLMFLALSLPLSVLGLGRPLSAWRCALLVTVVGSPQLSAWASPAAAVYLSLAPSAYLYLVGIAYDRRVLSGAWLATTAVSAVAATAFVLPSLGYFGWFNVFVSGLPTVVATLSDNTRARRLAGQALAEQMLRSAEEQTARALLEERSRIARELHDVVAHHMSVIAIHAETAPYRVAEPPAPLVESFSVIRSSALEALTEMRRLLTLLRSHDGAAETAPQPGLAQVEDLVATARSSGLAIQLRILGVPRPLPPGVDLSAFRIIQEGLSNALRHASGASMSADIEYAPDTLRLAVYNDRPPGDAATNGGRDLMEPGHGLLGMRERVAMLGGTLLTTPTPEGGFLVRATLPLDPIPTDPVRAPAGTAQPSPER